MANIPQNNTYYEIVCSPKGDAVVHHAYVQLREQDADLLRSELQHRHDVVAVIPITQKAYRSGVTKI